MPRYIMAIDTYKDDIVIEKYQNKLSHTNGTNSNICIIKAKSICNNSKKLIQI